MGNEASVEQEEQLPQEVQVEEAAPTVKRANPHQESAVSADKSAYFSAAEEEGNAPEQKPTGIHQETTSSSESAGFYCNQQTQPPEGHPDYSKKNGADCVEDESVSSSKSSLSSACHKNRNEHRSTLSVQTKFPTPSEEVASKTDKRCTMTAMEPMSPLSTTSSTSSINAAGKTQSEKSKRGWFGRRKTKKSTKDLSLSSVPSQLQQPIFEQPPVESIGGSTADNKRDDDEKKEEIANISILSTASNPTKKNEEDHTELTADDEFSATERSESPQNSSHGPSLVATATETLAPEIPSPLEAGQDESKNNSNANRAQVAQAHLHSSATILLSPVIERADDSASTSSQVVSTLLQATAEATTKHETRPPPLITTATRGPTNMDIAEAAVPLSPAAMEAAATAQQQQYVTPQPSAEECAEEGGNSSTGASAGAPTTQLVDLETKLSGDGSSRRSATLSKASNKMTTSAASPNTPVEATAVHPPTPAGQQESSPLATIFLLAGQTPPAEVVAASSTEEVPQLPTVEATKVADGAHVTSPLSASPKSSAAAKDEMKAARSSPPSPPKLQHSPSVLQRSGATQQHTNPPKEDCSKRTEGKPHPSRTTTTTTTTTTKPPTNITAPALNPSPVPSPKVESHKSLADDEEATPTTPPTISTGVRSSSTTNAPLAVSVAEATDSVPPPAPPVNPMSAALTLALVQAKAQASIINNNKNDNNNSSKSIADIIRVDLWSSDATIVTQALQHVTREAANEKSRSLIARTGGLFAVVRAMESHVSDSTLQIAGCQALEKLALDTENEIAIEQVGGTLTILQAMTEHFSNAAVQEAAWAALWNLTCSNANQTMTLDANTESMMQAMVAAMKEHLNSPAVQKNACGALANLCQNNPKRMQAFARAEGFSVIASALQRYWDSEEDVRAEACFALTALCEGSANQLQASRTTTLTVASPTMSQQSSPQAQQAQLSGGTSNGNRGYLPQRFTAGPVVPPSVLNNLNHHRHLQQDSDLRSLASLSYFEEEVFDD